MNTQQTPQLRTAYRKGFEAGRAGKGTSACPYRDYRTDRGSVTYARAFIHAWKEGWEDGREELQNTEEPTS